jgi:Cu-Zn family superoxide dismutase
MALLSVSVDARDHSVRYALAVLRNPGGRVVGFAPFVEDRRGRVYVSVLARGISPGLHGIHVHEVGSCDGAIDPPFTSAGAHFNPEGRQHGLSNPNGPHAGDLPNLWVSRAGVGYPLRRRRERARDPRRARRSGDGPRRQQRRADCLRRD